MLPWAIVVTEVRLSEERASTFYAIIFSGALVFSFFQRGHHIRYLGVEVSKGEGVVEEGT